MKILIDVNLSRRWKVPLSAVGHDVLHWEDVGPDDADDSDIMKFADSEERIILTNDLDFATMLAQSNMKKPSVVQLRSGKLRPEQLQVQVITALNQAKDALDSGAVVTVFPSQSKISILPLKVQSKG
jgi:predicted nuclease of predicted toxin-antitoxin system